MDWNDIELKTWRDYENARARYAKDPVQYRMKLFLTACLGVGLVNFLGFLFVLSIFVVIGFAIFETFRQKEFAALLALLFVFGFLLAIFLFAAFRRSKPAGMPLDPEKFGRLYDEVRDVCRDLNITPIRRIYLDLSGKAVVVSRFLLQARLKRENLVVGYPLICSLDAKSFRVCLTRALRHEQPSGDPLLKWIGRVWLEPTGREDYYHGVVTNRRNLQPQVKSFLNWFFLSISPLVREEEEAVDAYCREAFGAESFAAFVTRTRFLARRCDPRVFSLRSLAGENRAHPAAAIRDAVREAFPEAETKRILGRMLRESEPVTEMLPAFRERVRTDDPAALLPCMERTPDAAEHYLFSCPEFEAEYDAWTDAQVKKEKLDDVLRSLREADKLDETSADPDAWAAAAEAAARLNRADRERDILEKAVEIFPDCLSFRGRLLVRRMKDAVTDGEESLAAAELERLTEEDPRLVVEFRNVLCDFAARRGDGDHVGHLLAASSSAKKRVNEMKFGRGSTVSAVLMIAGWYVWIVCAWVIIRILMEKGYGFQGYFIAAAIVVLIVAMFVVDDRERKREKKAEKDALRLPDHKETCFLPGWKSHPPVFSSVGEGAHDCPVKKAPVFRSRKVGRLLFLLATLFLLAGGYLIFKPVILAPMMLAGMEAYVEGDYGKAVKYFRIAARFGIPVAQHILGTCFYYGDGVKQDFAEAAKWFRKAAEQGNADAQFNLALCYRNREGVEQDDVKAAEWFRKAAEQGNSDAQHNFGTCYFTGTGVKQDYEQALKWYRKAAAQGDSVAQFSIGICYENGYGVEKDMTEAVKWYRKAAEQKLPEAAEALERLDAD